MDDDAWTIYVWPAGHVEGDDFPEDFYQRLSRALRSEGLEWEPV